VVSSVDELKKMMQIFFKEGEKFNLILNSAKGFDLAKAFESLFINIDAAGGLVLNAENNLLAIYRLGNGIFRKEKYIEMSWPRGLQFVKSVKNVESLFRKSSGFLVLPGIFILRQTTVKRWC
jgi:hypothetical protein